MKLNLSNILTICRILVIPIIVALIYLKSPLYGWLAFILFCLASITDYFDGYIARLRNEVSNLGTFLDRIADKLLALAILILSESGISFIPILFIGKIALWSAAILTLYTGYDYLRSGLKHF